MDTRGSKEPEIHAKLQTEFIVDGLQQCGELGTMVAQLDVFDCVCVETDECTCTQSRFNNDEPMC